MSSAAPLSAAPSAPSRARHLADAGALWGPSPFFATFPAASTTEWRRHLGGKKSDTGAVSLQALRETVALTTATAGRQVTHAAMPLQDVWAGEVLGRIREGLERTWRQDPHEVFTRFCRGGLDVLHRDDLILLAHAFVPDLPESLHTRVWRAFNKGPGDVLKYDEFYWVCGPRGPRRAELALPQPSSPRAALSSGAGAGASAGAGRRVARLGGA